MKVLVTAASKYGSRGNRAQAIGDVLDHTSLRRCRSALRRCWKRSTAPGVHDAVGLGSAVYAGHWLSPAKEFRGAVLFVEPGTTSHAEQYRREH